MTLAMHEPLFLFSYCAMNGMKSVDRTMAKGFFFNSFAAVDSETLGVFFLQFEYNNCICLWIFFFVIQTATADGRVNNFFPLSLFAVKLNNKSASLSSLRFAFFSPSAAAATIWNGPRRKSICNHNALHNVDVEREEKKMQKIKLKVETMRGLMTKRLGCSVIRSITQMEIQGALDECLWTMAIISLFAKELEMMVLKNLSEILLLHWN